MSAMRIKTAKMADFRPRPSGCPSGIGSGMPSDLGFFAPQLAFFKNTRDGALNNSGPEYKIRKRSASEVTVVVEERYDT